MEPTKKRRYPIPILLLFLLHFAPAVSGFFKVTGMLDQSLHHYDPLTGVVYFAAFLVGWLFHFLALTALVGQWKKGYYICGGMYLLMAVLSFRSGTPLPYLLRLLLLALPSSRDYFGFPPPESSQP